MPPPGQIITVLSSRSPELAGLRPPVAQGDDRLRQFIKHAPAAIALFDREMRYLEASDRWLADHLLQRELAIGRPMDHAPAILPDSWKEAHVRSLSGSVECGEDEVVSRVDGFPEWMKWEMRPWFEPAGEIGGLIVSTVFITARKNIEAELNRANRALRSITRCKQAIARAGTETEMLKEICQAIVQVGGYRFAWVGFAMNDEAKTVEPRALSGADEAYVRGFQITWADTERGRGPTGTAIRTGRPNVSRNFQTDSRIGPWRDAAEQHGIQACVALPLRGDGRVFGALSIYAGDKEAFDTEEINLLAELADDLVNGLEAQRARADQLRSEEALLLSEERFRSAMLHSPIGMGLADPSGQWLEVNPAFCRIVGYTREEMLGMSFKTMTHPGDRQAGQEAVNRMLEGHVMSYEREKRYIHKDGHSVWVQLNFSLIANPDGSPRNFVSQVQDITGRRESERALRDFQTKLVLAMDMARLGHWEFDVASGNFTFDDSFYKLFGTSTEREGGMSMSADAYARKFMLPDEAGRVAEEIRSAVETNDPGYNRKLERGFRKVDGSAGVLSVRFAITKDAAGRTVKIYGLNQDITEQRMAEGQRRNLEEQLRQAQKMDALGTLAGGIAHDFNNILTGIIGNLQLAEMDLPQGHAATLALEEAAKASRRARDLVARILSFSRLDQNDRLPAPLGPIVLEAVQLLRASLPSTIEIRTSIAKDCPPVLYAAAQVHQVIMNLGTNAAHAMRETGGVLTVDLRFSVPGPALIERNPQVNAAHTVRLLISDSGCGMDEAVMKRIFEPFYTTKAVGEGTGLGLAVVHNIMQHHEGAIVVESALGAGTTFGLYFPPAICGTPKPEPSGGPRRLEIGHEFGNGRKIMLVDDEESVRHVGSSLLRVMGFSPAVYARPSSALDAFLVNPDQYSAVISDLTMPEMSGLDLARRIKAVRPGIPFILASGNFHLLAQDQAREADVHHVIEKPFDVHHMISELREALGQS
jgi:two-component system, cell cycle sensor histidine kinase and response regulator CckA